MADAFAGEADGCPLVACPKIIERKRSLTHLLRRFAGPFACGRSPLARSLGVCYDSSIVECKI